MKYTADNKKNIFAPKSTIGLGTAIEKILKPVARIVGRSGCGGCRRRAARLNKMVPNINPFA